jgi:aerobic carbon-monoxide dehydrogenase medium subunit
MLPFELVEPTSLRDALDLLDPQDPTVRPLAGGTALMLMMKAGAFQPTRLISLGRIEARYMDITEQANGEIRIGAMTPLSSIEHDQRIFRHFPAIRRTMRHLANVRVRNAARIGGTLSHGDPNMDLPPLFAALGARVSILGQGGAKRELEVERLYRGYYETSLQGGELISEVILPVPNGRRAAYLKCATRSAHDWPAVGLAIAIDTDDNVVRDARIMLGAATDKVTRLVQTEKVLRGATIGDDTLKRASDAAVDEVAVTADVRGSVAYKQELLRVYVRRAVRAALEDRIS